MFPPWYNRDPQTLRGNSQGSNSDHDALNASIAIAFLPECYKAYCLI